MRLVKLATASNFERLKPPYVGVTADSVIRLFFPFFLPTKYLSTHLTSHLTGQLVAHLLNLKSKDPLDLRKYIISSQLLAYFGEHSHNNVNELLKTWSSSLKELIPGEQDTQPGDELIQVAAERLFNEADTPAKVSERSERAL